jgi:glycosyltransferase involved in cell wall biosynthesis
MSAGGKERRLSQLIKGIKLNTDIKVSLVVMNKDIHYKEIFDFNIEIHYLIRKTRRDISLFYKFYKICISFRPDIVHCWDSMTAVYMMPTCKLLKIKIVNGMVVDTPVRRNILNRNWLRARITFPFSDVIVGNSNAGLSAYSAPDNKSVCIYNGIDLSRFDNITDRSDTLKDIIGEAPNNLFIIGMVAAFEERKDYKTLIKTALDVASEKENVLFLLVGDGSNMQVMQQSVPAAFSGRIIFLGKRSDVESIISVFDIGILLTNAKVHGEGISNSILEYMALGKPVIATRGGGTNEVIIDGSNGFLIDSGDADQLTEKIYMLMENSLLIKKFGNESRKIIGENFDIDQMIKRYVEIYNKLIS